MRSVFQAIFLIYLTFNSVFSLSITELNTEINNEATQEPPNVASNFSSILIPYGIENGDYEFQKAESYIIKPVPLIFPERNYINLIIKPNGYIAFDLNYEIIDKDSFLEWQAVPIYLSNIDLSLCGNIFYLYI